MIKNNWFKNKVMVYLVSVVSMVFYIVSCGGGSITTPAPIFEPSIPTEGVVSITGLPPQITVLDNPVNLVASVTAKSNGILSNDGSVDFNSFDWSVTPANAGSLINNGGKAVFTLTNAGAGSLSIVATLTGYSNFSGTAISTTAKAENYPTEPIAYDTDANLVYVDYGGMAMTWNPITDNRNSFDQTSLSIAQLSGTTATGVIDDQTGVVTFTPVANGVDGEKNVFEIRYTDFNYANAYVITSTVTVRQLGPPSLTEAIAIGGKEVKLTWEAPEVGSGPPLDTFNIWYSTDGNTYNLVPTNDSTSSPRIAGSVTGSTTTIDVIELTEDTTYSFKVSVINDIPVESHRSAALMATPNEYSLEEIVAGRYNVNAINLIEENIKKSIGAAYVRPIDDQLTADAGQGHWQRLVADEGTFLEYLFNQEVYVTQVKLFPRPASHSGGTPVPDRSQRMVIEMFDNSNENVYNNGGGDNINYRDVYTNVSRIRLSANTGDGDFNLHQFDYLSAKITIPDISKVSLATAPTAPGQPSAVAVTNDEVTFTWAAASPGLNAQGGSSYIARHVLEFANGDGSYTALNSDDTSDIFITDGPIRNGSSAKVKIKTSGNSYHFRVVAYNGNGLSTTGSPLTLHAPDPTSLTEAIAIGARKVKLTWTNSAVGTGDPDFSHYNVWYRVGDSNDYTLLPTGNTGSPRVQGSITASTTTVEVVELTEDTTYSFVVSGVNTIGLESARSAALMSTPNEFTLEEMVAGQHNVIAINLVEENIKSSTTYVSPISNQMNTNAELGTWQRHDTQGLQLMTFLDYLFNQEVYVTRVKLFPAANDATSKQMAIDMFNEDSAGVYYNGGAVNLSYQDIYTNVSRVRLTANAGDGNYATHRFKYLDVKITIPDISKVSLATAPSIPQSFSVVTNATSGYAEFSWTAPSSPGNDSLGGNSYIARYVIEREDGNGNYIPLNADNTAGIAAHLNGFIGNQTSGTGTISIGTHTFRVVAYNGNGLSSVSAPASVTKQ